MSEHAWAQENLTGYVAGGLEAEERERLEQHAATCADCAREVAEARVVDRSLETLFAPERPSGDLEDRMIQMLRKGPKVRGPGLSLKGMVGLAAAAAVFLAVLGAVMGSVILDGQVPFPGQEKQSSRSGSWVHEPVAGKIFREATTPELSERKIESAGGLAQKMHGWMLSRHESNLASRGYRVSLQEVHGLENDEIGLDPDLPTNYNVDRIEEVSVPKPATKDKGNANGSMGFNSPDFEGSKSSGGGPGSGWAAPRGPATGGPGGMGPGMGPGMSSGSGPMMGPGRGRPGIGVMPPGGGPGTPPPGSSSSHSVQTISEGKDDGKQHYSIIQNESGQGQPAGGKPAEGGSGKGYFDPSVLFAGPKGGDGKEGFSQPGKDDKPVAKEDPKAPAAAKNSGEGEKKGQKEKAKPGDAPPAPLMQRKIIRSGEIEYEVQSFDSAVAAITKLVNAIKGGFVATVNSDKLPNGKVRGSVAVRVPPEFLDGFVLDLRKELGKLGELKGLRIGSQDITKQYTDLESRLRAARAMEERLIQIIKTGKGEIKDLVLAEKELGNWRTKIEEFEGELRYYANLVALSSLTITLYEKEIQAPFALVQTERVQMGIEAEDVDKAMRAALTAVTEAKGRVTKSELKQHAAGQYSALLHFEVSPDAAGPLRDRLKQLGTVARLEIDRVQQTEGGSGSPLEAKQKRNDTQFTVSIYNLTNIAPRETVNLSLACIDVENVFRQIIARVEKAGGRVVTSNLNRQENEQTTGILDFEVKAAESEPVLLAVKDFGEAMRLEVTENPNTASVTRSKRGFRVQLVAMGLVQPRDTVTMLLASRDVPSGFQAIKDAVVKAKGRLLKAELNEQNRQNITADLDFDYRKVEEATIQAAVTAVGDVYSRSAVRAPAGPNLIDSKTRVQVKLINAAALKPRRTVVLALEVPNVDQAAAALSTFVSESKGRAVEAHVSRQRTGQITAKLVFDVPLSAAPGVIEKIKGVGTVRVEESAADPQVPDSELARARLDVTLSNVELIVPTDQGLWSSIRTGLARSFTVLSWSLIWLVFGICVVLPWALVVYGIYRVVQRFSRKPQTTPTTA